MEVLSRSYVQAEAALTREDPRCAGGVDQSPWHALVVVPLYCPPRESISGLGLGHVNPSQEVDLSSQ